MVSCITKKYFRNRDIISGYGCIHTIAGMGYMDRGNDKVCVFDFHTCAVLPGFFYLATNVKRKYDFGKCCTGFTGSNGKNGSCHEDTDTRVQSIFLGNVSLYSSKLWSGRIPYCFCSNHSAMHGLQFGSVGLRQGKSVIVKEGS